MFHYILLFINKVLYYIRNPFYTLKILFVILWLWFCDWYDWLKFIPLGKGQKNKSFYLIVPHSSFVYLSVTQVITEPFAILVIPAPQKTNVFLKILLTFAAQKRKRSTILYLQPLTLNLYLMHETATMEESRKFKC